MPTCTKREPKSGAPSQPGPLTNVYHADLFLLLCTQLTGGREHWPGRRRRNIPPARASVRGTYGRTCGPADRPYHLQGCHRSWRGDICWLALGAVLGIAAAITARVEPGEVTSSSRTR